MTYPKIANRIIEWGVIFLIVFTPIAFGTTRPWAYTIMELTVCFLVTVWIIRLGLININKTTIFPSLQPDPKHPGTGITPNSDESAGERIDESTIPGPDPGPDRRAPACQTGRNRARAGRRADRTPAKTKSSLGQARAGNNQKSQSPYSTVLVNRFGFIKTPLTIPIIIFVGLILFQLTPLPPGVLKILSPNTYKLYKTTLPDWQPSAINHQPSANNHEPSAMSHQPSAMSNQQSLNPSIPQSPIVNLPEPAGAGQQIPNPSIPQSSSPSWRSISVYKHATKTELYKILAYIGIFFLIVNYNPSTRNRQPITRGHRLQIKTLITRLIIAMVAVGCFESIYGLLECLSGHQHIFFRKKADTEFVTGTYVNLNHFAGYMAIVICMSFGYLTYLFSDLSKSKISKWRQKLSQMINLIGTRAGLLSFLILIMSSALILSGSRMGICSFITAIILMSIMISKKVSIKKILFIVLPICLMAVWIGLYPVINKFSHISKSIGAEGSRIQIWKDTRNLIEDFPVLGTGLGTYEYAFPKYKTIKAQKLYDHTHNDYLELISDTGFTGFIIVIAGAAYYLFIVIRMWFRRRNSFVRGITVGCLGGIAYILLHSLTDFNLQIPANALHLTIITGIMHKTITQL